MARAFANASSQYMTGTLASTLNYPYTISCHARLTSSAGSFPGNGCFGLYDASQQDHLSFSFYGSTQIAAEWQAPWAASRRSTYTATSTLDTWHHLAAKYEYPGDEGSFYVDGVLVSDGVSLSSSGDFDSVMIAARRERGGSGFDTSWFDGDIAECAVWDVALSAADVASLGAGVSPLLVRPDSLIFYAPLHGEASTDDEIDIVGGITITEFNSPAVSDHPPGLFYPTGPTIFPFSGGGVPVDGSISATGSISGIVGLELPLSGSVSASSGLDGVLDLTIGFSGTSSAASAVSGSMVASYSAAGEASSVASISGSIAAPGEFIAAADSSWTADSKGRSWTVDDAGRQWTVQ